jgi:hypothetical protein
MYASGKVIRTIGSAIYDYAVALKEGNFLVSNGDDYLTPEDLDREVIVKYTPQDLFCKVVPTDEILATLNKETNA